MALRSTPPALAAFAALLSLAGAGGVAHLVSLAAVVAASGAVLEAVTERVAIRAGTAEVVLAVAGLVAVVAAAALRTPMLGVASLVAVIPLPTLEGSERGAEPVISK